MAQLDLLACEKPYSKLRDRILWFDGDSTVKPSSIEKLIRKGVDTGGICTTTITPEIAQFNKLVPRESRIRIKDSVQSVTADWQIPAKYINLDIEKHVCKKLVAECKTMSEEDKAIRTDRVLTELQLIEEYGFVEVLRTIIYVLDVFVENNQVWGIGRGSAVSSYVLYLLGVHDVDSVLYELDPADFFHK